MKTSLVGCLLAALCTGRPALAQPLDPSADPDEARQRRFHFGSFYVQPFVTLENLGLDTNVFNTATDQKSDFTFTVGPNLDALLRTPRLKVLARAAADLVYYSRYETERSVNTDNEVRAEYRLGRVTLVASDAFLNTRQRPNFEIDTRARRVENSAQAGVRIGVLPKLAMEVAGRESIVRFDGDAVFLGTSLRDTLNRNSRAASMTLRYLFTPLTTLTVRAEAVSDRFEFSRIRNTDSIRIEPGVEFHPRALISGHARVGYRRFQILNDALPDFRGTVAGVALSYALKPAALTFGVSVDRDVDYSYDVSEPYYVTTGYGGSVRRQFGARWDITVGAGRHHYSYRSLSGTAPSKVRWDTVRDYSASLGFEIRPGARLGVGGTYYDRRSSRSSVRNYETLRFGTSVTYGF